MEARRIGSAIDPVLAVHGTDGRTVSRSDDSPGIGSDARIDFEAQAAGEYVVEVHDARSVGSGATSTDLVAGPIEYAEAISRWGGPPAVRSKSNCRVAPCPIRRRSRCTAAEWQFPAGKAAYRSR